MKIDNANILMSSSRTYLEKDEVKETLRVWVGQPQASAAAGNDRVSISRKAELLLEKNEAELEEGELEGSMEISLKKLIAEILSGRKVELAHIERVKRQDTQIQEAAAAPQDDGREGWGLQYDFQSTHLEKEDVSFNARGIVKIADGKEIGFVLKLDMSREYLESNNISIRAGDAAIDPLILNFDGKAAELTDLKFDFDLNGDGVQEKISMPTAGRGFLAIDLNRDGAVNDGTELFGPRTGNGFAELQNYDMDGNTWIDENDDVFKRLRIMTVDDLGVSSLHTLRDTGVGAIYLGKKSTQFDVRIQGDNSLLGQVCTTGIYLREDGTPDTIQQLDLVA